jgi:hypothetical protein
MMRVVDEKGTDWDLRIDPILLGYRVATQNSTQRSPFELMYGVKARLPTEITLADVDDGDSANENIQVRAERLATELVEIREEAKKNLANAQKKQKDRYDLKHQGEMFKVGDLVLRYNRRREMRMGDKLASRYQGPYEITEVVGKGVYRLTDGEIVLKATVNAINLKHYTERSTPTTSPSGTPTKQKTPTKTTSTPSKEKTPTQPQKTPTRPTNTSPPPPKQKTQTKPQTSPRRPTTTSTKEKNPTQPQTATSTLVPQPWVPTLNLFQEDLEVLNSNGWLNDRIIDAVNQLAGYLMGVGQQNQTTLLAEGAGGFEPATGETVMVIHDRNHWVAVACINDEVLVADSAHRALSREVKKQLRELFQGLIGNDGLRVRIVPCATQPNAIDCGVFAAAFVFEWGCGVAGGASDLDVVYADGMRQHLIKCLESGRAEPFPRSAALRQGRRAKGREMII